MPFDITLNRNGTYRIQNAVTGRVYAYATKQPKTVIAIVERYAHELPFKKP